MACLALPAVSDMTADLKACAAIDDVEARVACYDRVAARVETSVSDEPEPEAPVPDSSATTGEATADSAPAPGQAARAVSSSLKEKSETAQKTDAFGAEQISGKNNEDKEADEITAYVAEVIALPRGNHQITLDNDQVWRENRRVRRVSYEVGDKVTISRGLLGSYRMKSHRTGMINKVRRIK